MKYSLVIAAICLALSAGALRADEGRIPIAGPTTITAQGHYILTRDVQVSGDTGIVVDATHVTLDLNGHILSTSHRVAPIVPRRGCVCLGLCQSPRYVD